MSVFLNNGQGGFPTKTNYETGANPSSVALGDVTGDSIPDLVVANLNSNSVSVRPGLGGGAFDTKQTEFPVADRPFSVKIGDVSGEGDPDLVVANYTSGSVSVLLGDGVGGFGPNTDFVCGVTPRSMAMGDVDRDGNLDVVVGNFNLSEVGLLPGDGVGGFGSRIPFATGAGPYSVALDDVTGDERLDLSTANMNAATVTVRAGNGAGGFGPPIHNFTGTGASAVVVGDVTDDGRGDLVVTNYDLGTVSVVRGLVPTRTTLSVLPNPATLGSQVTLVAQVSIPASGYGVPADSVRFFDGTTLLGTALINGSGAASLVLAAPRLGDRPLVAVYKGSGNLSGSISPVRLLHVDAPVSVSVVEEAVPALALEGVRPNPTSSGRMTVTIVLPSAAPARLDLLDVRGRSVMQRDVGSLGAGRHAVDLASGQKLAAGVYFVRLVQGDSRARPAPS